MEISDGSSFIRLKPIEVVPDYLPAPGDTRISVYVNTAGFVGTSKVWLEQASIQEFLSNLTELEQTRNGTAQIESISPNEFLLHVRFYNELKHPSFDGYLSKKFDGLENRISFSLRPDTSMLKQYVVEFHRLFD